MRFGITAVAAGDPAGEADAGAAGATGVESPAGDPAVDESAHAAPTMSSTATASASFMVRGRCGAGDGLRTPRGHDQNSSFAFRKHAQTRTKRHQNVLGRGQRWGSGSAHAERLKSPHERGPRLDSAAPRDAGSSALSGGSFFPPTTGGRGSTSDPLPRCAPHRRDATTRAGCSSEGRERDAWTFDRRDHA